MSKHTPGPWEVIASTSFPGRYLIAQRRSKAPVLAVADTIQVSGPEEEANARLIAAAPDLLAALERAEVNLTRAGESQTLLDVRDAIAKAKGDA